MSIPGNARILTVEDDPIVRQDLRLILEHAGYVVCSSARDGIEAVEQARRHRPDLIVMDIGLPQLDGIAATARILEERDVPVVALTGHANHDWIDRARRAGAVRHVAKPFSEDQLIDAVADVFSERQARLEREAHEQNVRIMIESMVRADRSEREIVSAVEEATATERAPRTGRAVGFGRRRRRGSS
jgi:CheY-like chemotaxis protein